jgi:ribose 5-phosphate isomerase B
MHLCAAFPGTNFVWRREAVAKRTTRRAKLTVRQLWQRVKHALSRTVSPYHLWLRLPLPIMPLLAEFRFLHLREIHSHIRRTNLTRRRISLIATVDPTKCDRMKIAIGSDHAGFRYKEKIKEMLKEAGHEIVDFGTDSEEPCDYPLFIRPVAEAVARKEAERGIVLGGSGNGEAITANRVVGVRCGLCWNEQLAKWNRAHNDGNVLSLGQRTITEEEALHIVNVWLEMPFEGGRHVHRIYLIDHPEAAAKP